MRSERLEAKMIRPIDTNLINRAQSNIKYSTAPEAVNIQMPEGYRNYVIFDQNKVNHFVSQREKALPYLKKLLQNSQDEKQIVETLYIVDRMLDAGVKGIPSMYPVFSRFNNTQSSNIQSFLAGIYRKTQVPDAFGPLIKMLIQNSVSPCKNCPFEPNEEIGGAILSYISNYSKGLPKIDYQA